MRSAILASALAALALAVPVKRQATAGGPDDATILNFALTLEHLENAFYSEVLSKFTIDDFRGLGLDNVFFANLERLKFDENAHVTFLTTALSAAGAKPVVPNEYSFGITDAASAVAIANVLEGVGVSAYLGAAQYIADGTYLTAAGSILTIEARHSAVIRESQNPILAPFPNSFDTPLSINEVYTLAAPFITGDNNPGALPVKAFTALTYAGKPAAIGETIEVTTKEAVTVSEAYFASVTGPIKAELTVNSDMSFSVVIPEGAPFGQSYLLLTSGGVPTDANTVGPAVVEIQDYLYGIVKDEPECKSGAAPVPYTPTSPAAPTKSSSAPSYSTSGSTVVVTEDCEDKPASY